jgi:SAM-dependent methyltransferase
VSPLLARIRSKVHVDARRDGAGVRLAVDLVGRPFSRDAPAAEFPAPAGWRPEAASGPRLNVGGGKGHPHMEGWTIVDLRKSADVVTDIANDPLPFEDASVGVVFTSHTLEHIRRDRLGFVLSEFHRVLRPGGLLRVAVPDIDLAVRAYVEGDSTFFAASEIGQADETAPLGGMLASWFYSTRPSEAAGFGHVHAFDFDYLAWWLERARFGPVWRSAYRSSVLPELRGDAFDRHPRDSLYVEALKRQ